MYQANDGKWYPSMSFTYRLVASTDDQSKECHRAGSRVLMGRTLDPMDNISNSSMADRIMRLDSTRMLREGIMGKFLYIVRSRRG